jgi:hypothetical protein
MISITSFKSLLKKLICFTKLNLSVLWFHFYKLFRKWGDIAIKKTSIFIEDSYIPRIKEGSHIQSLSLRNYDLVQKISLALETKT